MQVKIQVTEHDIRKALERHAAGFTEEPPVVTSLERSGYRGAMLVGGPEPHIWAWAPDGLRCLKIKITKRMAVGLSFWKRKTLGYTTTYITTGEVIE